MTEAASLMERVTDTNATCLYALLRAHGFTREDHSPRIIQGKYVTVAANIAGYRITFPSTTEPHGMAIVDLPLTVSYGTVETVATSIEHDCRWDATNAAEG